MGNGSNTPSLLRRIAALEATVGRLGEDLGTLRSAVRARGLDLERSPGRERRDRIGPAPADSVARRGGGLAGAATRGEAARIQWVRDGVVVPGDQLAGAWGLTRQALAAAVDRGEAFSVKVGNRLYYPKGFLRLERSTVAAVCRALGDANPTEKLMFWLRGHGALGGRDVTGALESGIPVAKVARLAAAWAHERGAMRAAAAA